MKRRSCSFGSVKVFRVSQNHQIMSQEEEGKRRRRRGMRRKKRRYSCEEAEEIKIVMGMKRGGGRGYE